MNTALLEAARQGDQEACDQVIRESKKLLANQRPRLQAAG